MNSIETEPVNSWIDTLEISTCTKKETQVFCVGAQTRSILSSSHGSEVLQIECIQSNGLDPVISISRAVLWPFIEENAKESVSVPEDCNHSGK